MNPSIKIDYDPHAKMFSLNDLKRQELIILRKDQLEALIDEYCLIFGRIVM